MSEGPLKLYLRLYRPKKELLDSIIGRRPDMLPDAGPRSQLGWVVRADSSSVFSSSSAAYAAGVRYPSP
jgi:hypothetical protein